MSQITLEIPDEALLALKVSEKDAGGALRMAAAMKLFELGQLSSGAAARLAGVPRVIFLSRLADYGERIGIPGFDHHSGVVPQVVWAGWSLGQFQILKTDTFDMTAEDLRKETRLA